MLTRSRRANREVWRNRQMDQSSQPTPDRRRFFGFGLKALGYAAPAVSTPAVPALLTGESQGGEFAPPMMRMMKMMMKMMPPMMGTAQRPGSTVVIPQPRITIVPPGEKPPGG